MPNWCQNKLVVEGPIESLSRFRSEQRQNIVVTAPSWAENAGEQMPETLELSFAASVPEPHGPDDEGYDWYRWRLRNWGTKWNLGTDVELVEDGDRLVYQFDTAWSPPAAWLENVAQKYDDLTFTLAFVECGMELRGTIVAHGLDCEEVEGVPDEFAGAFGEYF